MLKAIPVIAFASVFVMMATDAHSGCRPAPDLCVSGQMNIRACTNHPEQYIFPGDQCFYNSPNCSGVQICDPVSSGPVISPPLKECSADVSPQDVVVARSTTKIFSEGPEYACLQLPDPATNQSVSQFHCLVSTSAIKDGRCSTLTQSCEAGVTSIGAKKAPAVRVYRGREKGAGNWCFEAHNETGRPIDVELVGTCCSPPLVEWVDHLDLRFIPSFIGCAPLTGPPKNPPAMKGNLAMLKPNGGSGAIGKSCITVPEDTKLSKLYCFLDGAMVQDSDLGSLGTPITHPDFGQVYIGRMSGRNLAQSVEVCMEAFNKSDREKQFQIMAD